MHILTYSNALARISCGGLLLESDERPALPFGYDALYFEPPTGLAFKVLAGEQLPLSAEEIAACKTYCDTFLETADYPVFAYDAAGVFVGSIRKSEAQQRGLSFSFPDGPPHPASKWTGEAWVRIRASILDDGTLILDPATLCDRCAVALTAEEWAQFPAVPATEDGEVWKWDFAAEAWKDVADPMVFAFDEADAFVGQHKRSTAASRGWGWRLTPPDGWPYKNTPQGWQRVEAVIYENGSFERLPNGIRNDVVLLFTREEWAAWPQRPRSEQGEIWEWNFAAEAWQDVSDPYGCTFETDDNPDALQAGVYAGDMHRSEARAKGLGFTRQRPEHPVSKWNGTAWERVAVVFMDNGTVRENPESLCSRCLLPLTAAEWAAWPQPPRKIPAQLGGWSWNFVTEVWEDRRDPAWLRDILVQEVYQVHGTALNRELPDHFDLMELHLQAVELLGLEVNPQALTPFVSARWPHADNDALAAEIVPRYTALATAMGRLSARRAALLNAVKACADNAALDALFVQLLQEITDNGKDEPSCSRA